MLVFSDSKYSLAAVLSRMQPAARASLSTAAAECGPPSVIGIRHTSKHTSEWHYSRHRRKSTEKKFGGGRNFISGGFAAGRIFFSAGPNFPAMAAKFGG